MRPFALPSMSLRFVPVWRRNLLVWRKLAGASVLGNLADPLIYVLGLGYATYPDAEREAVVQAHPRSEHFKEDIIQAFYDGIRHKPQTTFGAKRACTSRSAPSSTIRRATSRMS